MGKPLSKWPCAVFHCRRSIWFNSYLFCVVPCTIVIEFETFEQAQSCQLAWKNPLRVTKHMYRGVVLHDGVV